jgi:hypothetical protein
MTFDRALKLQPGHHLAPETGKHLNSIQIRVFDSLDGLSILDVETHNTLPVVF